MTRQEKIQKLIEFVFNKNYGDIIPHWEIEQVIGEKQKSNKYNAMVGSAKKRLLKVGKMVENVKGVGYRVVNPDEYTNQAAKLVSSGARRIDHGAKVLENAPVSEMSPSGVQVYNVMSDKMKILQAAVTGSRVEANLLTEKRKHPLSLLDRK